MIVVADAGPLLHLHWVGASEWALPPLPIQVVDAVWTEVARHAPDALGIIEAFKDRRVGRTVALEALRALPARGRMHVAPALIEVAAGALGTGD